MAKVIGTDQTPYRLEDVTIPASIEVALRVFEGINFSSSEVNITTSDRVLYDKSLSVISRYLDQQ